MNHLAANQHKHPITIACSILAILFLFCPIVQAQVPVALAPVARQQFFSQGGVPLAGGLVYFYNSGTSTPATTYYDGAGLFPQTNPVVLDAGGFATIYLAAQSYKVCVNNSLNVQQYCVDPVNSFFFLSNPNIWSGAQTFSALATFNLGLTSAGPNTFAGNSNFSGPVTLTNEGAGGNVFTGPVLSDLILYVSVNGNDINTGFSYGAAKATLPGAFAACVSSCKIYMGGGTFTVSSTTTFPVGGTVLVQGINMGGTGGGGTRIVAATGSVNPMLAIQGASSTSRTTNVFVKDLTIQGVYTASQQCITIDHATYISFEHVQFENCGQAEWVDDAFRVIHNDVSYFGDGSGGTNTTAMVRVENTSNPSAPTEQVFWVNSVWQGDSGQQGSAVYFGPATGQERIIASKLDYSGDAANFCLVQINQAQIVSINDNTIFDSNIASPAQGTICVDGSSVTRSAEVSIVNNPAVSLNNTIPAIYLNYTTDYQISGNGFIGLGGGGTAVVTTANTQGGTVLGNEMDSSDTILNDVSGLAVAMNRDANNTQWDLVAPFNAIKTTGGLTDTSAATKIKRLYTNQGTALTTAAGSLTGWGTGASFVISGQDPSFAVTFTSGSGSIASNPSLVVTFADGAWLDQNPVCQVSAGDVNSPGKWYDTSSTTQVSIVYAGTPNTSTSYTVNVTCTPGR